MPFYIRDSITVGPFRFNISKSGPGLSVGLKGLRFGTGPRGHYIHAGRNGLYYRATVGGKKQPRHDGADGDRSTPVARAEHSSYLTEDGILMRRVVSGDVERMHDESLNDLISEINEARGRGRLIWPFLGLSIGASFLLMEILKALPDQHQSGSVGIGLAIGLITMPILMAIIGNMLDLGRKTSVLAYDLDNTAQDRYRALTKAFDGLMSCEAVWWIDAKGRIESIAAWKRHAGAGDLVNRERTAISYGLPRGVESNVTPPAVTVGK